eukprot:c32652_g1_i1.p1 GENE.c32652_g1_i1~~c32652_g1_i1.p1  ORF type:complete len:222 (+),score=25.21 c32652_g1_i1:27-668(+)
MTTPADPSGCPVNHNGFVGAPGFTDDHLDPRNMMPAPNQLPHPEQTQPLSLNREKSSIPKSDKSEHWVYPSPQMFYNALKRKGKGADVTEETMESVVAVHNRMNEKTWRCLLEWEDLHSKECDQPRLVSFRGRPDELSPKARLLTFFKLRPMPFDRHDWIIDRAGRQVRYVIDYYYDESSGKTGLDAIDLDVRPALDSPTSLYDRVRMFWAGN